MREVRMAGGEEHRVVIERRGRGHRACCACGWNGHRWNELRPAEADAWHHMFGDEYIVDLSVVAEPDDTAAVRAASRQLAPSGPTRREVSVDAIVSRARALADNPTTYRRQAVGDLWRLAGEDRTCLEAAISEISELLKRHSRSSASTADSEWLQLITARQIIRESLDREDSRSYM